MGPRPEPVGPAGAPFRATPVGPGSAPQPGPRRGGDRTPRVHPVNGIGPHAATLAGLWRRRPNLDGEALALALLTAASAADHEEARRSRVVASGPFGHERHGAGPARMTAAVFEEVLHAANRRLLVVGYAHHASSGATARLAEAAERGVHVDMVFEDKTGALESFRTLAEDTQGRVRLWRWPEHTRGADGKASLHAKVLVADRTLALVGSANLTGHALRHNPSLVVSVLVVTSSCALVGSDSRSDEEGGSEAPEGIFEAEEFLSALEFDRAGAYQPAEGGSLSRVDIHGPAAVHAGERELNALDVVNGESFWSASTEHGEAESQSVAILEHGEGIVAVGAFGTTRPGEGPTRDTPMREVLAVDFYTGETLWHETTETEDTFHGRVIGLEGAR